MKTLTKEDCLRKANQHWEMFSLAASDGDWIDADKHRTEAKLWELKSKEF